jgi:hypothetical protein
MIQVTRAELKELYVQAAIRARAKPQRSEEDLWLKEFEHADPRDLKAAIDAQFQKSHWMPKESELRPLVEQARHSRELRNSEETVLARWECQKCRVTRSGFILPADHRPRSCHGVPRQDHYEPGGGCGGAMNEVYRAPYKSDREQRARALPGLVSL